MLVVGKRPVHPDSLDLLEHDLSDAGIEDWTTCRPSGYVDAVYQRRPVFALALGKNGAEAIGIRCKLFRQARDVLNCYLGVPAIATWHPDTVLRNPTKGEEWTQDIAALGALFAFETGVTS